MRAAAHDANRHRGFSSCFTSSAALGSGTSLAVSGRPSPRGSGRALVRGEHWPRTGAACQARVSAHPGDDRSAGPRCLCDRAPMRPDGGAHQKAGPRLLPKAAPGSVKAGSGKQDSRSATGVRLRWRRAYGFLWGRSAAVEAARPGRQAVPLPLGAARNEVKEN
jgi:hypothetical protein